MCMCSSMYMLYTLLSLIIMHSLFILQFFYAIASTKSSNIIVLCLAEIMVSCIASYGKFTGNTVLWLDVIGNVFCFICAADEDEHARGL